MSPDLKESGKQMKRKWNPIMVKRKIIELDERIAKQKLEELAELFYDAFCELHKTESVEPKLKKSCHEQEIKKAG